MLYEKDIFTCDFNNIVGDTPEKLQRLGEQYDSLHKSLISSPFNPQVEQQFQTFRSTLDKVNVIFKNEAMLYVAALSGNRDAAALILKEHDLYLYQALNLSMEDGPNWDALEFMVDLDRNEARYALDNLVSGASVNLALLYLARDKDTTMTKHLIDRLGANPATVASLAQAGGKEDTAAFLRDLAEMEQLKHSIDEH